MGVLIKLITILILKKINVWSSFHLIQIKSTDIKIQRLIPEWDIKTFSNSGKITYCRCNLSVPNWLHFWRIIQKLTGFVSKNSFGAQRVSGKCFEHFEDVLAQLMWKLVTEKVKWFEMKTCLKTEISLTRSNFGTETMWKMEDIGSTCMNLSSLRMCWDITEFRQAIKNSELLISK